MEFDTEAKSDLSTAETNISGHQSPSVRSQEISLPARKPRQNPTSSNGTSKNIIKNYGRAFCTFASSSFAKTHIEEIILKNDFHFVNLKAFMSFFKIKKDTVSSIESIRKLLVADKNDNMEILTYKKMFQELSIIFLKFYAVNWIFSGRLMHKSDHLKFRFKMLRRVQNPEYFTYLKTTA